jgi:hypothetical protein
MKPEPFIKPDIVEIKDCVKTLFKVAFVLFFLYIIFGPSSTSKKQITTKQDSGKQELEFVLPYNNKTAICRTYGPFLNVFIEPRTWLYLSHREKEEFAIFILEKINELNQRGTKIGFFSIFNITTNEQLAKGNIGIEGRKAQLIIIK